ncbi:MAG: adenylate/guanylate cyclase domain-containing protein, partial [Bacteroidota bacterium]
AKMIDQIEIDDVGKFIWSSSFSKTAPVILIYTAFVSILFGLIRQTDSMFGPGILRNLITGKYHHPKEEERIFMFIDLKSSTTYAERLGHILYSELIQDCFFDLTDAIQAHEVEVYQYVGDEAVLTWKVRNGLKNANCLRAFFTFEQTIQKRADYYFNKYDLVPVFKAGGNMGLVMTAEVGVVKREIAYHSDVLNTAARIQSCCNSLGHRLLISEYLYQQLPMSPDYTFEEVGAVSLKGKMQEVNIYSVEPTIPLERKFEFTE